MLLEVEINAQGGSDLASQLEVPQPGEVKAIYRDCEAKSDALILDTNLLPIECEALSANEKRLVMLRGVRKNLRARMMKIDLTQLPLEIQYWIFDPERTAKIFQVDAKVIRQAMVKNQFGDVELMQSAAIGCTTSRA